MKKLTTEQKKLRARILEISHQFRMSHIGSCFTAVDLLDAVYSVKKKTEPFILSNGHAGVALYTILEKYEKKNAEALFKKHGVHPNRDLENGLYVSTGSLGQGLPIAVGFALSNRKRKVYCMISDGELAEGSMWEALRISQDKTLSNLIILLNANGWGAYGAIPLNRLYNHLKGFGCRIVVVDGHNTKQIVKKLRAKRKSAPLILFAKTKVNQLPFLRGQDAHYHIMMDSEYEIGIKKLT